MEKKGKIIFAVSLTATLLAVGTSLLTVELCRRIYEKHYFTVSDWYSKKKKAGLWNGNQIYKSRNFKG